MLATRRRLHLVHKLAEYRSIPCCIAADTAATGVDGSNTAKPADSTSSDANTESAAATSASNDQQQSSDTMVLDDQEAEQGEEMEVEAVGNSADSVEESEADVAASAAIAAELQGVVPHLQLTLPMINAGGMFYQHVA